MFISYTSGYFLSIKNASISLKKFPQFISRSAHFRVLMLPCLSSGSLPPGEDAAALLLPSFQDNPLTYWGDTAAMLSPEYQTAGWSSVLLRLCAFYRKPVGHKTFFVVDFTRDVCLVSHLPLATNKQKNTTNHKHAWFWLLKKWLYDATFLSSLLL